MYQGEKFRKLASDPLDLFAAATSRLMSAFLQALEQDQLPPCSAEDNLHTLALMLAAYESDESRSRIALAGRIVVGCSS